MQAARSASDVFHAIADGNRRKILDLLAESERPVRDLVDHFDISFAAVSQHLQILHEIGLVSRRAQGRQRLYRANPEPLRDVYEWAGRYRRFWEGRLDALGTYLDDGT